MENDLSQSHISVTDGALPGRKHLNDINGRLSAPRLNVLSQINATPGSNDNQGLLILIWTRQEAFVCRQLCWQITTMTCFYEKP